MSDDFASMEARQRLEQAFRTLTREGGSLGWSPFRWQVRLLIDWLLAGKLPISVDIPTGLGKTSVMALWLIALAEGAQLPRRLVYVVDRRAVVDQATRFAEQLKSNLSPDMASSLGLDGDSDGLPISTLRGGFTDNRKWLEDPSKPAVIVGTIDMIGSRLLFEGYGVSRKMRPYHAGLLAVDSLVLLDEAHLCPPFEYLLRHIAKHRDGELGAMGASFGYTPPFHLMSLSATGRGQNEAAQTSIFKLDAQDCDEPEVFGRLNASKRLGLTELTAAPSLVESLADRAAELGYAEKGPSRVLICCNSRKDALAVKELLDKECKRRERSMEYTDGFASELLVGERRVYERQKLESWLEQQGFLGGRREPASKPVFLVATSAGEVGVDLDADHMVCDLVAYERMVQRLGRVNRRGGKMRVAMVDVFWVKPELKANASKAEKEKHEDLIDMLKRHLAPLCALPKSDDGRREASPAAITELKVAHPTLVQHGTTPVPLYPALNRPLLDSWAMTSFETHTGRPEVAPWLRGWEEDEEPQTTVVWRHYMPDADAEQDTAILQRIASDYFQIAPIHATEKLEAASSQVFDWLLKRVKQISRWHNSEELAMGDDQVSVLLLDHAGQCVRSASFGELKRMTEPTKVLNKAEIRAKRDLRERHLPGKTLVVDARLGGVRDGMLDEKSETAAAADVDEDWKERREDQTRKEARPLIKFRVEQVAVKEQDEGFTLPPPPTGWRYVRTFEMGGRVDGPAQGLAVLKWHDDAGDEDSNSVASKPQLLREHAEQVVARVRDTAERLNMPADEIEALVLAARLHDDGKAAQRWQTAMNAPSNGKIYAKTEGGGNHRLLEGYRHEFGSLLKAERESLPEATRDLILHLIAAHHGNARPLISSIGCGEGPPSQLEVKAGDAALRFARLQNRYGPWGLAWREAILRAADQSASRDHSRRSEVQRRG